MKFVDFTKDFLSKLHRHFKEILRKINKFRNFQIFSQVRTLKSRFLHVKIIFFVLDFSISIQNCLRNPKITLRTPCEHFKNRKTSSAFFNKFYQILHDFARLPHDVCTTSACLLHYVYMTLHVFCMTFA